jgi:hypothetical protein
MAHFAKINENNVVETIIVVGNDDILDENGQESEAVGKAFIASIGLNGTWVQTSYNGNFRERYASTGMIYDSELDIFHYPQEEEMVTE